MQISQEGFSKNLAPLSLEGKQLIEENCREFTNRLLNNFQDYVREKLPLILPFAAVFGEIEGKPALMVIPFLTQLKMGALAAVIGSAVRAKRGIAFVAAYDGYTSYLDDPSNLEKKRDRKDAIITVWRTAWDTGEHVAVRYAVLSEFGPQFESPTVMDAKKMMETGFSVFDSVFKDQKLPS